MQNRLKNDDSSETICPRCRQRVPLRREGTIVKHYEKIKASYGRKGGQRVCPGSQEGKL